jgi:ribosome-binding factor A
VFVSVLGTEAEKQATYEGLESVTPHLRHRVARAIRLRVAPDLVFKVDETVQRAARIESLLAEINSGKPRAEDAPDEDK